MVRRASESRTDDAPTIGAETGSALGLVLEGVVEDTPPRPVRVPDHVGREHDRARPVAVSFLVPSTVTSRPVGYVKAPVTLNPSVVRRAVNLPRRRSGVRSQSFLARSSFSMNSLTPRQLEHFAWSRASAISGRTSRIRTACCTSSAK